MYNDFYGLEENPFSISPDPKYFYLSERHNQAFAHLSYGLKSGGAFVLLTGEVGTGKTTVSRRIINVLPDDTDLAIVYNPTDSPRDLLASICREFGDEIDESAGISDLFDALKTRFFANCENGRKSVIVIDEAQMLSEETLEKLRLLTNLETDNMKAVQVVLIGQPELQEILSRQSLRQLSQRITARYHIMSLDAGDVDSYIRFRLQIAGRIQPLFNHAAIEMISRASGGIPRLINLIADRCIEEGSIAGNRLIGVNDVRKAIEFISPENVMKTAGLTKRSAFVDFIAGKSFIFGALALAIGTVIGIGLSLYTGCVFKVDVPEAVIQEEIVDNTDKYNEVIAAKRKFAGDIRNATSKDDALLQLLRVWGYDSRKMVPCSDMPLAKLECNEFSGSLADFVKLNHPAVVRLYDSSLVEFYATLVSVGPEKSYLYIDGTLYEIDTELLKTMWDGQATIVWKLMPSGSKKLSKSSSKEDFSYMSTALSRALGREYVGFSSINLGLTSAIKAFQEKEGLTPDGLVGERTIMLLNARGGANMPRLSDPRE